MTTNAQRLREFHRQIGLSLPDRPAVPTPQLLALRRTLIDEEVAEVRAEFAALAPRLDAGETLDASALSGLVHELADLLYVTYGALDTLGVDADAIFAELHRANLSKASGPRRADGKQLRPQGWQPADIVGVLARQMQEQG